MLDMILIDLKRLVKDKRESTHSLAKKCGINYTTLINIRKRGTIKPSDLPKLEKVYNDIAKYIN